MHWNEISKCGQWTSVTKSSFNSDADVKSYFDTVEHNLNTAIYYCAAVINYFMGSKFYQGCGCEGEHGEDGPMQRAREPMGDRFDKTLTDENSIQLGLFDFMGFFGVVMTLTALKIVKKLNDLVKLHPELYAF